MQQAWLARLVVQKDAWLARHLPALRAGGERLRDVADAAERPFPLLLHAPSSSSARRMSKKTSDDSANRPATTASVQASLLMAYTIPAPVETSTWAAPARSSS